MDIETFSDTGGLSAEELELLSYLLEEEGVEIAARQTIFPREQQEDLPLSFAQSRLWFLDQLDPGITAYNIVFAIRVDGRLDLAALWRSLNEIVRRHEVLRTTFPAVDGEPIQAIAPALRLDMPLLDLRALPKAVREAAAYGLAGQAAQWSFDLARGPLIVARLLRLSEDEYVVLLIIHHIVFDGWSTRVFLNEVITLYDAFASGRPAPLPPLPIQYADFALWQREWLQGEVLAGQLAYWRRQLSDRRDGRSGLPMLRLPLDRPRPPRQTYRGARCIQPLSPALAESLTELSQQKGMTPFMVLLAAFAVLLYRYTGQDDIVVGSPIANRDFVELEPLVGFFVNTLLLRADLSGDPSFSALLGRVRDMTLDAYAHQHVPFERVAQELQPERSLSHQPLFQVMFSVQSALMPSYDRSDLSMAFLPIESGTTMFDLLLSINEMPTSLNTMLGYNTDLFDAATMRRLLGHYQVLLEAIAADADRPISRLPLLTAAERAQVLEEWNSIAVSHQPSAISHQEPAEYRCVHELVAAQAARTPDAVAIQTTNDQRPTTNEADPAFSLQPSAFSLQMTYAELDRRANQLARHLRTLGVGPEVLVGVCMERSVELIVALLGVLKAGGAYLPLDPRYPAERIAFMLEDSRARVLITTNDHRPPTDEARSSVVGRSSLVEVDLARDWPMIAGQSAEDPASGVTADNLAYVIYTSGSVGRPKGVAIAHRGLVNYVADACGRFAIGRHDAVLQFASISFDTAAEEIYPCLARGARLVLRSDALLGAAASFLQTCGDLGLTVLDLPTAYWHQLTAEIAAQGLALPKALRLVIIGGEPALPDRLALWRWAAGRRVRLANTYGPTEVTIAATCWELPGQGDIAELYIVPIGRPISNTQAYVLDAWLGPAPLGVAGELYIGGAGLARGYLGRPDLTAERFVPNPFAKTDDRRPTTDAERAPAGAGRWSLVGGRLYRTGDVARWLVDGTIEFLGRLDGQIKLRGFRVEPGEIETVLAQHPAVRECAVVAREDAAGTLALVAYVAPTNDHRPTTTDEGPASLVVGRSSVVEELRTFLAERLPEYMVPSTFVPLDGLPMTPSGKVDRRALPAPDWSRRPLDDAYIAPRTPVEATVAGLAAEVLGVERVGVRDNFFALGGHSLLIVRLLSRIQKQFGQSPPVAALFQNPTVEHLAHALGQQAGARPASPLVGIQTAGSKRPLFCVHGGAGNVICYVELARCLGADQPFYGLQAAGLDDDQPPRARVEDMAGAYLEALRAVQPEGPYLLSGWSFGGMVAFEMARQLEARGERVALLALLDSWGPGTEAEPAGDDVAPAGDDVALLAGFAQDLGRMFGKPPHMSADDLRRISPQRRLRYVLEQARAANVLPPDIDEQQIRRALDVFAANVQAMRCYRPPAYAGHALLFRASEQPAAEVQDPALGWGAFVAEGLTVQVIPGDHYTIVSPPHVRALAERLSACIDAAQEAGEGLLLGRRGGRSPPHPFLPQPAAKKDFSEGLGPSEPPRQKQIRYCL